MNRSNSIRTTTPDSAPLLNLGGAGTSVAGKIRAGIQVLTARASQSPIAKRIYQDGMASGQSFSEIEASILAKVPRLDRALEPANVPYFSARRCDFDHPLLADQILERYGEVKADGQRRLYRFPVVFLADNWQDAMPHQLITWNGRERLFWSEYSQDGRRRFCMERAPEVGPMRGLGRTGAPRSENGGRCDPDNCPEFQARLCRLQGRFLFAIPGVRSGRPFSVSTSSFQSMRTAVEQFQTIRQARGGRLSGYITGSTPFLMSKRSVWMEFTDQDGETIRKQQWVIDITADVDLAEVMEESRDTGRRLQRAALAVGALELGRSRLSTPTAPAVNAPTRSDEGNAALQSAAGGEDEGEILLGGHLAQQMEKQEAIKEEGPATAPSECGKSEHSRCTKDHRAQGSLVKKRRGKKGPRARRCRMSTPHMSVLAGALRKAFPYQCEVDHMPAMSLSCGG